LWKLNLEVPRNVNVEYRYFIACVDSSSSSSVHVKKWETHLKPRYIASGVDKQETCEVDTFGIVNGVEKIDKGWLVNETIFQFKFFNNPFLLKDRIKKRKILVKITPLNLRLNAEKSGLNSPPDESCSNDTRENQIDQLAFTLTEVATLTENGDSYLFSKQEQFGRLYQDGQVLVINAIVTEPENIAYLVDLYSYSTRGNENDLPSHLGYHYLLPNMLKNSEGTLELPITCAYQHRPLGMMKIEFLKITPLNHPKCNMAFSYCRHWNQKHQGLDVGHRGAGTSFKASSGTEAIRENTIASMKKAASVGAAYIEFDVQLSKDLFPVIYHDFNIYVCLKKKATMDANDMLELPMRDLTLEQLKNLKVFHTVEGRSREQKFYDEELIEHQPFPLLSEALDIIDPKVGFNVEIKSAQQLEDGTLEANHVAFDKNLYVDRILDVVLEKAGMRRIVFSSFDADICVMLRNKQNIYPVMFLTLGKTSRYKQYSNPYVSNS
jgi:glycerophosphocholine phosphodiesterase GPCPD1